MKDPVSSVHGHLDLSTECQVQGFALGLAGASFAAIVAICSSDNPVHGCLWWSLLIFSIALPASLLHAMHSRRSIKMGLVTDLGLVVSSVLGVLVYGLPIFGMGLLLLHISGIVGGVFLGSSVFGVLFDKFVCYRYSRISFAVEQQMPELAQEVAEYQKEGSDQRT